MDSDTDRGPSGGAVAFDASEITVLLGHWRDGDSAAFDQLLPLVYDDLRRMASKALVSERPDHTLLPTDLVHEAYLRLARTSNLDTRDRSHFFSVAARAMRRILIDHARRQLAQRRVGAQQKVPLDEVLHGPLEAHRVLGVDEALKALGVRYPRAAQLVELRFFGGFSESESAEILGISRPTATRDWRFARLWLLEHLDVAG